MWHVNRTLLLFDLDGTLLDSAPHLARFAGDLLERHGYPRPPESALRAQAGQGAAAMLALAGAEHLSGLFLRHYREESACFPGVEALLSRLPRWGIVSNKPRHLLLPWLARSPLRPTVLVCGDDMPQRKPQPEPLLQACQLAGCSPREALYVGDDPVDEQAARAAGMAFIAAGYGHGRAQSALPLRRFSDLEAFLIWD